MPEAYEPTKEDFFGVVAEAVNLSGASITSGKRAAGTLTERGRPSPHATRFAVDLQIPNGTPQEYEKLRRYIANRGYFALVETPGSPDARPGNRATILHMDSKPVGNVPMPRATAPAAEVSGLARAYASTPLTGKPVPNIGTAGYQEAKKLWSENPDWTPDRINAEVASRHPGYNAVARKRMIDELGAQPWRKVLAQQREQAPGLGTNIRAIGREAGAGISEAVEAPAALLAQGIAYAGTPVYGVKRAAEIAANVRAERAQSQTENAQWTGELPVESPIVGAIAGGVGAGAQEAVSFGIGAGLAGKAEQLAVRKLAGSAMAARVGEMVLQKLGPEGTEILHSALLKGFVGGPAFSAGMGETDWKGYVGGIVMFGALGGAGKAIELGRLEAADLRAISEYADRFANEYNRVADARTARPVPAGEPAEWTARHEAGRPVGEPTGSFRNMDVVAQRKEARAAGGRRFTQRPVQTVELTVESGGGPRPGIVPRQLLREPAGALEAKYREQGVENPVVAEMIERERAAEAAPTEPAPAVTESAPVVAQEATKPAEAAVAPEPQATAVEAPAGAEVKPARQMIFTEDKAAAARDYFKSKRGQGGFAGLGGRRPKAQATLAEDLKHAANLAGYHIESGLRDFGEWSAAMIRDAGDWIKPHLKALWDSAHATLRPALESPGPEQGVGAAKNAVTEAARVRQGLAPVEKNVISLADSDARGKALVDSGRIDPVTIAEQVNEKPRVLSADETHALGYYSTVLDANLSRVRSETDALIAKGQPVPDALRESYSDLQGKLDAVTRATTHAGTEWSAAGRARQTEYERNRFSLERLLQTKRIAEGRMLTDTETATIREQHAKLVDLQAQLDRLTKAAEARGAARVTRAPRPVRVIKSPAEFGNVRWGESNTIFTRQRYDAALLRVQKKTARLGAGIDPTMVADLAEVIGFHVESGVRFSYSTLHRYLRTNTAATDAEIQAAYRQATNDTRLAATKKRAAIRLGEIEEHIAARQPLTPKPPRIEPDMELMRTRAKIATQKLRLDAITQPKTPRTLLQTVAAAQRESILSGPSVFSKLFGATVGNWPAESLADFFGLPGARLRVGGTELRSLGAVEGESLATNLRAIGRGTKALISRQAVRDAWDVIRQGVSEVGVTAGVKPKAMELGGIVGRVHGAEKAFLQRAHFEKSMTLRLAKADRLGLDIADPAVQEQAMFGAANDAWSQILQSDSKATSFVTNIIGAGERASAPLGFFLRTVVPIVRVPLNYLGRTVQMTGAGIPEGAVRYGKMVAEFRQSGKMPTPAEADAVQKAFKYGGVGLVAAYLGLVQPDWFKSGGYYGKGRNLDSQGKPLETDTFEIGGVHIPRIFTHSPFGNAIQFWATVRREYAEKGLGESIGQGGVGLAEQLPGAMTVTNMSRAGSVGKAAGAYAGSFVPQLLQQEAKREDKTAEGKPTRRKPRGFVEEIKVGIPGLRKQVPASSGNRGRSRSRSRSRSRR